MPSLRTKRPGCWPGRSNVLARRGMVCSSQPLASAAGQQMLVRGGNAIDAAIATAATLCVVEPMSTGLGGDLFALYWSAKDQRLKGLNGSGRCPSKLSWRTFARVGKQVVPQRGWLAVTVPGTVDAWWTLHQAEGRLPWKELFEPAIHYAHEGFPVSEIIASHFSNLPVVLQNDSARAIYLPEGRAPGYGTILRQPDLGRTLSLVAEGGAEPFYRGEIAREILRASDEEGGYFSAEDLSGHRSTWVEPLRASFRDLEICQLPPNGQGLAVLIALNVLTALDPDRLKQDWAALAHASLEAVKAAYAERDAHVADPEVSPAPLRELLSMTFATRAAQAIDPLRARARKGSLLGAPEGDTVYLCAADGQGNLVSLINSLYFGFGSGVVAGRSGVLLQNRGSGFSLQEGHPNLLQPGKRPFHTIIPGFALRHGKPSLAFGVMGGHHQAQGQFQFLINLLLHEMGLQEALAAPRFDFRTENFVGLERDYPGELREALAGRGHQIVQQDQGPFGGGQAIRILPEGVLEGASDPRKDGLALGW